MVRKFATHLRRKCQGKVRQLVLRFSLETILSTNVGMEGDRLRSHDTPCATGSLIIPCCSASCKLSRSHCLPSVLRERCGKNSLKSDHNSSYLIRGSWH